MQKIVSFIAILIVLVYAVYNANFRHPEKVNTKSHSHYTEHIKVHKTTHYEDELSHINSDEYTKNYIIKVINQGSNSLNFKSGVMEAGFASPNDAEKIACYARNVFKDYTET